MKKETGFDAFFTALTSSPEFKTIIEKDWSGDSKKMIDLSIEKMDETFKKASKITSSFEKEFNTPEAYEMRNTYLGGESGGLNQTQLKQEQAGGDVQVQYFTKKDDATWGFAGVAGMNELKNELKDSFINPLKFKFLVQNLEKNKDIDEKKSLLYKKLYKEYEKFKISIPTGILFYGPPGTGKTFITKKLRQELNAGYIEKSAGEFGSSYQHQTSQNIKAFFEKAKKLSNNGPILLFLDEIDSILSKRTDNIDASKAEEVSQFLQEFNKLPEEAPNLIIVAATNRPDHLDPAILRSGRFDKKIYIGPPDKEARKELFEIYIKKFGRPSEELDFDELAELTENYVAADIENICDEVSRDASKHILDIVSSLENRDLSEDEILKEINSKKINMDMLRQAIKEIPSSLKTTDMSIYENWAKQIEN